MRRRKRSTFLSHLTDKRREPATEQAWRTIPIASTDPTKQPLDTDLTNIAALATLAYGRGFLTLADAAAGRTYLSLGALATLSSVAAGQIDADSVGASEVIESEVPTIAALNTFTNTVNIFGPTSRRLAIGDAFGVNNYAGIINAALSVDSTNYALIQDSSGYTLINAATGQEISFRIGNSEKLKVNGSGVVITAGSISGITDLAVADGGTGASTASAARDNLGLGTANSPQFTGIEVGNASDTTLTRASAGNLAVEGNALYRAGGTDVPVADGGTGASSASSARTNLGVPYDDTLPWTIDIDPFALPHTQTNWSTITTIANQVKGAAIESSGAQNAEIGWDVTLAAGTWTLSIVVSTFSNNGIITASIDGSSVGTIDLYTAGAVLNSKKSITGITVATTGKKRLLLKMATKNASASAYYCDLSVLALRRTA